MQSLLYSRGLSAWHMANAQNWMDGWMIKHYKVSSCYQATCSLAVNIQKGTSALISWALVSLSHFLLNMKHLFKCQKSHCQVCTHFAFLEWNYISLLWKFSIIHLGEGKNLKDNIVPKSLNAKPGFATYQLCDLGLATKPSCPISLTSQSLLV